MDQTLSLLKDLLISISVGVGTIIAIIGLGTWKKQIGAEVEYEAARKLLRSTYKLRDSITWVRNPFITAGEMTNESDSKERETDQHKKGIETAYKNRWQKVTEAHTETATNLLEVEVLWGRAIRDEYDKLTKLVTKLYSTIYLYLAHLDEPEARLFNDEHQKILYSSGDKNDDFMKGLENQIKAIETLLKPHLNRKK